MIQESIKIIELTRGQFAIVDERDFKKVSKLNWCFDGHYAQRASNGKKIRLHRFLLNNPKNSIDHINGDALDYRRSNLRVCKHKENMRNGLLRSNNSTGFKGVSFSKQKNKFVAQITVNYRKKHLGLFKTPKLAAMAYDCAAKAFHKRFARLNFATEVCNESVGRK